MFDKMKDLWQMQKKMQEVKRQLDEAVFEISSSDGVVKVSMNGTQEVRQISIQGDIKAMDKNKLETALKDVHNRAIKRSHDIAAEKMKGVTGLNLPGLG